MRKITKPHTSLKITVCPSNVCKGDKGAMSKPLMNDPF